MTRPTRGEPKPANFDALAMAWDDPVRFGIERAKYQAQLHDEQLDIEEEPQP